MPREEDEGQRSGGNDAEFIVARVVIGLGLNVDASFQGWDTYCLLYINFYEILPLKGEPYSEGSELKKPTPTMRDPRFREAVS